MALLTSGCTPGSDDSQIQNGDAGTIAIGEQATYGFSPGADIRHLSDASLSDDLAAMLEVGASWIRLDIDWSIIEPEPGRYDWDETDRLVEQATANGLQVLGLLTYTPSWARPPESNDKWPPDDEGDFADFATAAVTRYQPLGVHSWEIWNEPNSQLFWAPKPDPARYGRLLTASVDAIRAVDKDAVILSGGLAPGLDREDGASFSPLSFLQALIDFRALDRVDAVAVHPYSFPARPLDPESARWNTFLIVPDMYRLLVDSQVDPRQIWITEYGAPTGDHPRSVDETDQSVFILDALDAAAGWPWAGPTFVYGFRDVGSDLGDLEDNYGIVRNDGSPKQSWHQLRSRRGPQDR